MKRGIGILVIIVIICTVVSPVFAAERDFGKDMKNAGRATVNYPANVVKDSAEVTGKAGVGTAETAVSPLVALWRSITGKGKPEQVLVDPVNKGGKTVKDATVGTVVTPYNAGKETVDQNK